MIDVVESVSKAKIRIKTERSGLSSFFLAVRVWRLRRGIVLRPVVPGLIPVLSVLRPVPGVRSPEVWASRIDMNLDVSGPGAGAPSCSFQVLSRRLFRRRCHELFAAFLRARQAFRPQQSGNLSFYWSISAILCIFAWTLSGRNNKHKTIMMMGLDTLTAVSPIDGRYRNKTASLAPYFSEYALMRYRLRVEIEYFIALCELPLPQLAGVPQGKFPRLRAIYEQFSESDAAHVKEIEQTTNHDVKAIEYYIKERFDQDAELAPYKEFIHFGLTSQDINNTAFPLMLDEALKEVYLPLAEELAAQLEQYANDWRDIPLLARTHGQPASPTRLGKEVEVFVYRLRTQLAQLKACPVTAKFGGATGNFNAHHVAYPDVDWITFADKFVKEKLGMARERFTTQISNYDNMAGVFDALKRVQTVILDLDRDFWMYISMDYFKQQIKAGEVGSSAMPHKVNPIDFENSEGNLGLANAILEHLSCKLPVSRLQRDLTDSTVIRNIGVPLGHAVIAMQSTLKGLRKLLLHEEKIREDLGNTWAVVAEAIQTVLRREHYPHPYETLKALTRTNEVITEERIENFIDTLSVSPAVKDELRAISPFNYTGI